MNTPAVDLFTALGRAIPALPEAACVDRLDVFDSETPGGIAAAVAICQHCPELVACAAWAATMEPRKLLGVVAGQDRNNPTKRRNVTP
jgi:hypothetical protein